MHIFFKPNIEDQELILDENESGHCVRVLRLKANDSVNLIDGAGGFYTARIIDANPKKCRLVVYQKIEYFGKRQYSLTIAIAPTKNMDRFEWFIEKACEIGIDRIIPIVCQQSERKTIKTERLNKIIIEAIKQSQQAYIPFLEELVTFKQLIESKLLAQKFIAYCNDESRTILKDVIKPKEPAIILIGPEGDFAPDEIKLAMKKGFKGISLGDTRLRTETAGIAACLTVAIINQ
jgi:16S rRNA (uracil1498-N3)-methyltransferase